MAILTKPTVESQNLPIQDTLQGRRQTPVTNFPELESSFPELQSPQAAVFPQSGQAQLLDLGEGMLGRHWFAGRAWTFDYREERLLLHRQSPEPPASAHTVDLNFKTDSTGRRISSHPRVEATIDGEPRSFLFDTGATTVLKDSALRSNARTDIRERKRHGTGFVIASVFDRWREHHPDWLVLEDISKYQGGTPLIRVPEVTIAGHTVGPVWFERRPDRAFRKRMAKSMDQPVDGALGGSLFQYFRITVNYPEGWASFQRRE